MRKIKDIFNGKSKEQLKIEIQQIKEGCENKIDSNGDCSYYSSQGNLRLCSKCSRNLKIAKEILKLKNESK